MRFYIDHAALNLPMAPAPERMLKIMSLEEGDVVSVKVNDNSYTLAQMRANGIMQFFDIVRRDDHWSGVDLNDVGFLFFVFVADKSLGRIFT